MPIGKTEKPVIDKKKQIQDSNNLSEQNRNSTRSTSANSTQLSNPSFPIRNQLLPTSVDHVLSESETIKRSVNQTSGNKENNVHVDVNNSDHVYVDQVERNQHSMKERPSSSLQHSEMNNYLKDMFMHENTNIVDSFQEKESFPKKNIINGESDKSVLQARNTYHRSDIDKVDKETVNDESFKRSKNHRKKPNCNSLKYSSASPPSLYLNEMKAALHPASNSYETEVHSSSEAALGTSL